MKNLKICTAIRNKNFEDEILKLIKDDDVILSNVNIDDIVNGHRNLNQIFIVEDNYLSILNLIEFHNSCFFNFMPVILLSASDSKYKDWIKGVKYPTKYFHVEMNNFKPIALQTIKTMLALAADHHNSTICKFKNIAARSFHNIPFNFRAFLNEMLETILDIIYAERGSIMLLNEKSNLVIEAASKKSLVGVKVPPCSDSVAWTVMNTMKPVFVENIEDDPRFTKSSGYAKDYFMSLPIFLNKKIAGVLNLSDKTVSLLFDDKDYEKAKELIEILEPYLYIEKLAKYVKMIAANC